MTKKRMLSELDSVELTEWEAWNRLHPLDEARRNELSAATTSMLIHNANVGANHEAKPASYFMPEWGKEYRPVDPEDMPVDTPVESKIDAIFGAMAHKNGGM
jgi:hypothetical protein